MSDVPTIKEENIPPPEAPKQELVEATAEEAKAAPIPEPAIEPKVPPTVPADPLPSDEKVEAPAETPAPAPNVPDVKIENEASGNVNQDVITVEEAIHKISESGSIQEFLDSIVNNKERKERAQEVIDSMLDKAEANASSEDVDIEIETSSTDTSPDGNLEKREYEQTEEGFLVYRHDPEPNDIAMETMLHKTSDTVTMQKFRNAYGDRKDPKYTPIGSDPDTLEAIDDSFNGINNANTTHILNPETNVKMALPHSGMGIIFNTMPYVWTLNIYKRILNLFGNQSTGTFQEIFIEVLSIIYEHCVVRVSTANAEMGKPEFRVFVNKLKWADLTNFIVGVLSVSVRSGWDLSVPCRHCGEEFKKKVQASDLQISYNGINYDKSELESFMTKFTRKGPIFDKSKGEKLDSRNIHRSLKNTIKLVSEKDQMSIYFKSPSVKDMLVAIEIVQSNLIINDIEQKEDSVGLLSDYNTDEISTALEEEYDRVSGIFRMRLASTIFPATYRLRDVVEEALRDAPLKVHIDKYVSMMYTLASIYRIDTVVASPGKSGPTKILMRSISKYGGAKEREIFYKLALFNMSESLFFFLDTFTSIVPELSADKEGDTEFHRLAFALNPPKPVVYFQHDCPNPECKYAKAHSGKAASNWYAINPEEMLFFTLPPRKEFYSST